MVDQWKCGCKRDSWNFACQPAGGESCELAALVGEWDDGKRDYLSVAEDLINKVRLLAVPAVTATRQKQVDRHPFTTTIDSVSDFGDSCMHLIPEGTHGSLCGASRAAAVHAELAPVVEADEPPISPAMDPLAIAIAREFAAGQLREAASWAESQGYDEAAVNELIRRSRNLLPPTTDACRCGHPTHSGACNKFVSGFTTCDCMAAS